MGYPFDALYEVRTSLVTTVKKAWADATDLSLNWLFGGVKTLKSVTVDGASGAAPTHTDGRVWNEGTNYDVPAFGVTQTGGASHPKYLGEWPIKNIAGEIITARDYTDRDAIAHTRTVNARWDSVAGEWAQDRDENSIALTLDQYGVKLSGVAGKGGGTFAAWDFEATLQPYTAAAGATTGLKLNGPLKLTEKISGTITPLGVVDVGEVYADMLPIGEAVIRYNVGPGWRMKSGTNVKSVTHTATGVWEIVFNPIVADPTTAGVQVSINSDTSSSANKPWIYGHPTDDGTGRIKVTVRTGYTEWTASNANVPPDTHTHTLSPSTVLEDHDFTLTVSYPA